MLDVLGEAALRTTLLAATLQLGLWLFRIRRPQLLLVAWTVVLAASLAMPALQWATPFRLPILPVYSAAQLIVAASPQQPVVPTVAGPMPDELQQLPALGSWLEAFYLLVSGAMVLRLVVGLALSLRLLRTATPSRTVPAGNYDIRISRAVAAPVTVAHVILLPPDFVDWPAAVRQAVVAHEGAHVARGDYVLLALSQLNRALFWFSPVSWMLHRRLSALAELVSDDHAMRVVGDRARYAEILLDMGRRSGKLLRGLAMARASTLQYRIERVLSDRVPPFPVSGFQRSMIVVGAALVTVAAASPDFNPAAPLGPVASGRVRPDVTLADGVAPRPVQPVSALRPSLPTPSPIEDAARPFSRAERSLPQGARALPQRPFGIQIVAHPVSRPMTGTTHPSPPTRAAQLRSRASGTLGEVVARTDISAAGLPRLPVTMLGAIDQSNGLGGVREVSHQAPSQREGQQPGEPSLLKIIDQQTCNGVYLPGAVGGAGAIGGPQPNGWGALNLVRAKFFREADGKAWLKFYLGARDPVNLPVTVTGKEVEFIASTDTSFKMLPQGANHLTGTTQRPNGTIDFACGEVGAHLFDRKS